MGVIYELGKLVGGSEVGRPVGESGQEGSFLWRPWGPQDSAPSSPESGFECHQARGPDLRSAERPSLRP